MDLNLTVKSEDLSCVFEDGYHIEKLLENKSLNEIVDLEQHLKNDIKVLDSNMKSLVYDNYNKLLQASEIIENMSFEFEKIKNDLSALNDNIKDEFSKNMLIVSELKPFQDKFIKDRQNQQTHSILKLLYHSPEKLERTLKGHNYDKFIQLYQNIAPLINSLRPNDSLLKIFTEVNQLIAKVKKDLYEEISKLLDDKCENDSKISHYLEFLTTLGESPSLISDNISKTLSQKTQICEEKFNTDTQGANVIVAYIDLLQKYVFTLEAIVSVSDDRLHNDNVAPIFATLFDNLQKRLPLMEITDENFGTTIDHLEWVYTILSHVNSLLENQLSDQMLSFAKTVKMVLISGSREHVIKSTIKSFETHHSDFLEIFNDNYSSDSVSRVREINSLILLDMRAYIDNFISYFTTLLDQDPKRSPFYHIFDLLYKIEIYDKFVCGFFKGLHDKFQDILGHYRVPEHPEILLHSCLLLDLLASSTISRCLSDYDMKNAYISKNMESEIIEKYRQSSRQCFASFVHRYSEINLISKILDFFDLLKSDIQPDLKDFDFGPHISRLIDISGTFMNITTCLQSNLGTPKFSFVSNQSCDLSFTDPAPFQDYTCEDVIDYDMPSMVDSVYKMVAKSILESFRRDLFTAPQIISIQKMFFAVKRGFFKIKTLNRKFDDYEILMLLVLKEQNIDFSILLSDEDLEES